MKVIAWPAFKTRYKNPYTWLLYSHLPKSVAVSEFSFKRLLIEKFDIFHLHWPVETLVRHPNIWMARMRVLAFWMLLTLSKWRGTKIVWTIHDEKPHVVTHPKLADWFTEQLVTQTDGYINLCEAGRTAVAQSLPGLAKTPSFVVKHGHYRGCYADEMSAAEARSQLDLSPTATVLLYLGYISPYKNVPHLIDVFRQLPSTEEPITLLIAGKPDDETIRETVRTATGDAENIQLHLRFIRDDELQVFFKAADLVVLPFEEILNSGSLLLSLSFNRPVLAPHLGAVADWQAQVGGQWVKTYAGSLSVEVLGQATQQLPPASAEVCLDELEWDAIAQQTLDAYQSL
ncbi:MAG: glycosyltransferase [Cyanobacteria bacterium J06632_3]